MATKRKISSLVKGIKGEMRKAHFASGGTPRMWRGTAAVQKTKDQKRNDRTTAKKKAIKESGE
jgi:hypothetical protein